MAEIQEKTVQNANMEQTEKPKKGKKIVQEGKQLEITLRRERASELYLSGASVRQISERLTALGFTNCKKSTIANDIDFVLRESAKKCLTNGKQILGLQVNRINRLILPHWSSALQGDLKRGEFIRNLIKDLSDLLNLKELTKATDKPVENIHVQMSMDELHKMRDKRNEQAMETMSLFEDLGFDSDENE
jgi:hypothetical protein